MARILEPQIFLFPEMASTNEEMKQMLKREHLDEGTIIITDHQVAGRGQAGNSWESVKGQNLTFSLLLRPIFLEPYKQFYISKIVSLAIIDSIKKLVKQPSIKWPNDIYIGNKKLAGILIENSIMGAHLDYCIIGIGLNVNQEIFISDAPNPISLKQATGRNFDLAEFRNQLIENIDKRYNELITVKEEEINKAYFDLLYRKNGIHAYKDTNGLFKATIESVNEMGLLTLKDDSGNLREYAFKEVEFIK